MRDLLLRIRTQLYLYTVCSPASMAMAVFIPLCVAAIDKVLFVNWDRHCCIIMKRFVWFCTVRRLYGFVTRYLLIRRTLPWISLRHPSGFPNHPHYLHIGQRHIKHTLIHESAAQCMDNTQLFGQRHYTIPDVIIWPSRSEEDTLVLVNINVALSKRHQVEQPIEKLLLAILLLL